MSTSSFDQFRSGLAVFALLVIIFEGLVMLIPDKIVTDAAQQGGMELKNERALAPGRLDAVILGDCFFFAGVNPAVLDEKLNIHSFNFAINRVQTYLMSYVLLKDILEHSAQPPRLIILGVHASSLYYPLDMDIDIMRQTILPFFRVSKNLLDELPMELKMQVIWHDILTKVPSLHKQYLLRGDWVRSIASFDQAKHDRFEKELAENGGFFNEDLVPHPPKMRIGFDFPSREKTIQAHNDRYIRKILELAQKRGIKVIIVTNSYRQDFMEHIKHNINFDVEYFTSLRGIYPNVIGVLDMHSTVTDFDRYVDITHLDGKGASLFTENLAEKIKRLAW